MFIREINLTDADPGANPHQAGPRPQPALRDRAEVVDLHLDRGETSRPGKMVLERAAHCRVGKAGGDSGVYRSRTIEEFGANATLDGETIAMHANQLESKQVIERMPGQEIPGFCDRALRMIQVWWF
jgi:hypothetical protein